MKIRDGLRKIGAAFLPTREVSSQECVYRCMPELWLRKSFPSTVFVNTDLANKRVQVAKTKEELDELENESTDYSNPTSLNATVLDQLLYLL